MSSTKWRLFPPGLNVLKRSEAIKASERVGRERYWCIQFTACKNYRSCKQRKKRAYRKRCVENIEKAYMYDKSSMWYVLDKPCREISTCNEPQDASFYEYFKELSTPPEANISIRNMKHALGIFKKNMTPSSR